VYMFTNTAAGWKQATELKGSDTVADNGFGVSVAISGTTAIVGAQVSPRLPAGHTCSRRRATSGTKPQN